MYKRECSIMGKKNLSVIMAEDLQHEQCLQHFHSRGIYSLQCTWMRNSRTYLEVLFYSKHIVLNGLYFSIRSFCGVTDEDLRKTKSPLTPSLGEKWHKIGEKVTTEEVQTGLHIGLIQCFWWSYFPKFWKMASLTWNLFEEESHSSFISYMNI